MLQCPEERHRRHSKQPDPGFGEGFPGKARLYGVPGNRAIMGYYIPVGPGV